MPHNTRTLCPRNSIFVCYLRAEGKETRERESTRERKDNREEEAEAREERKGIVFS